MNNTNTNTRTRSKTISHPEKPDLEIKQDTVKSQSLNNSEKETFDNYKSAIKQETDKTISKVAEYFHSELLLATDDINLLENFNQESIKQFNKMSLVAQELIADGHKMNQAFSDFEPYLKQIDDISRQIDYLELVSNELDEYSFDLEEKIKSIKKRKETSKKMSNFGVPTNLSKR
ncbi:hypothetical protein K502DRAFT_363220 [Neoconidiobolus thromboides FSU 785]|nr:hypothetical protein K502DRAFT_363220 [Neoconidiobolus thromboides FSU 785]